MSVYLQHCEPNLGARIKKVSAMWSEHDENVLRESNTKSNQIN